MSASDPAAARAEQIAAFLAAPTPRPVPADLRRAALRQSAPLMLAVMGALFVLMGLVFLWVFFPWNFYRDARLAAADTATTSGRVVSTAHTNLTINKTRVMSYEFEFLAPGGARVHGTCFTTGERWRAGNSVTVRYRPEDPAVCCIDGARASQGNWGSASVVLFPLIGAGLIVGTVIARRRTVALLERGFLAEALITGIEQTNVRVNNRYVHKISLARTDAAAGGAFVVKQTSPDVIAFAQGRMDAQQPVFVLYDPAKPKRALLPEAL